MDINNLPHKVTKKEWEHILKFEEGLNFPINKTTNSDACQSKNTKRNNQTSPHVYDKETKA